MIEYIKGNILDSNCEALVNTVNCYGKMGKGIALLFKHKFPKMFLDYKRACDENKVKIGKMHVWKDSERLVINFPTKDHWRYPSKMEWIVLGLQDLVKTVQLHNIKSIAIPALGCGNGGLLWYMVKSEIKLIHDEHWNGINVTVYEPSN